jgi:hypothetical protein
MLVPAHEPERYFRQFLHSPQASGLPNSVAGAFIRGIESRHPGGIESKGRLLLNLIVWCDGKQSDDGRSPFDSNVRKDLETTLDHLLNNDPPIVEYIKKNQNSSLIRALVYLQMSAYGAGPRDSAMEQLRPQLAAGHTGTGLDYRPRACDEEPVMRCANCKSVRYCSAACQEIGWRGGHNFRCSKPTYEISSAVNSLD